MQGVVRSYDPASQTGVLLGEPALVPIELRPGSLTGSIFRGLHTGQRVLFDIEQDGDRQYAVAVRVGPTGSWPLGS